jgi:hypothetical protein
MDNTTYLQTFQSYVEAIDHLNDLGVHMSHIKAWIQEAGSNLNNTTACECTKNEICKHKVVFAQV